MEAERYEIPQQTVDALEQARARDGRVVAVGTTVVRTLEYAARATADGRLTAGPGSTDLYILPGFTFRVVDAMITNFHLPRSTPMLLVSALAGRERLLAAYQGAIEAGYRFYSYGDAMLVL
jgi:S-adenosylmethionine:tRNA ribosyltransferase-isomerase